jgi:hypothetical protein
MVMLPVRDLGATGLITDVSPYNLPLNAYSKAFNVRFDEGKVKRASVFRTIVDNSGFLPRAAVANTPSSGFDTLVCVADDWSIQELINGTYFDRSGSITGSSDPRPFASTSLANISYINREDRVPVYRTANGTNYADLPNWPSDHRCKSLRAYGDFLVALNTTETLVNYPTRVRFSDIALANSVPSSWDETDTTKSAGFNDLVDLKDPILDGLALQSNFIIYSQSEVMLMEFVGGTFLFNFRKLFNDAGLINTNCVVEVEGKHYCFTKSDIYVHDGTSKESICDNRIREFVFKNMNAKNVDRYFVHHDPVLNEVHFCFQSGDPDAYFPNANRCNRSAVYNYRNNTWSIMDLPNVSASSVINVNNVKTYSESTTITYDGVGGSYYDQEDSFNRQSVMIGESDTTDGITSAKVYGLDTADNGRMTFEIDAEATKPVLLERIGMDMDEIRERISGYKVVNAIYPQIQTQNTQLTNVTFEFGASDIPQNTPTFSESRTYDIASDYKIDSRVSGRYLSYRLIFSDNKDVEFSGFDLDVTTTGRR